MIESFSQRWPLSSCVAIGVGVLYGSVLALFGFFSVLSGEGTCVPLALFSAPFFYLGDAWIAVAATPILWGTVGFFFGRLRRRAAQWALILTLICHYIGAALLLSGVPTQLCDPEGMRKVWILAPELLVGGFGVYIAGQVVAWVVLVRVRRIAKAARSKNSNGTQAR